jgi:hypothetical protein
MFFQKQTEINMHTHPSSAANRRKSTSPERFLWNLMQVRFFQWRIALWICCLAEGSGNEKSFEINLGQEI